jgi:hypothetical protein
MATSYQILGQVALSTANSESTLYAVPDTANNAAVASTLTVCNQGTTDLTFRVRVAQSGASLDAKQWLFYDTTVYAKSSLSMTMGLTLGRNERVYVSSSASSGVDGTHVLSFNLFGSAIS